MGYIEDHDLDEHEEFCLNQKSMKKFSQGDKIQIEHEDGSIEVGEFHRYGASRYGAIAFFDGAMRFVDEQSLKEAL
jgi:ribosomal protein L21E